MAIKSFQLLFPALLVGFLLAALRADADVSCALVHAKVASCKGFVTAKDPTPPNGCCFGLNALKAMAVTVEDRRAICKCLKALFEPGDAADDERVAALPGVCGVAFAVSFSRDFNCDS